MESQLVGTGRRLQPDPVFRIGRDGRFLDFIAAPGFEPLAAPDCFVGRLVEDVLPDWLAELSLRYMALTLECGALQTFEYTLEVGEERLDFECRMVPGSDDDVVAVVRDVTQRRQGERWLEAQLVVTRALAEAPTLEAVGDPLLEAVAHCLLSPLVVLRRVSSDGALQLVAARAASPEQAAGARGIGCGTVATAPGCVVERGETVWMERTNQLAAHGLQAVSAFPVCVGGEVRAFIEAWSERTWRGQERLRSMVESIASQVGQFLERREAEQALRRSEAQLRQSQKLEAVGVLSGGLAHDFNNILASIVGRVEMALDLVEAGSRVQEDLLEINFAAERGLGLTRQLLFFARPQAQRPAVLRLDEVIEPMLRMLERLLGDPFELETRFAEALPYIIVDQAHVEQVLLNLVLNARDAMPTGGTIRLETGLEEVDAERAPALVDGRSGSFVYLEVSDTGTGMDSATRARLFEPFFTTKPEGKGTGLGLAIVRNVMREWEGAIEVRTAPGRGTTLRVLFPRMSQASSSVAPLEVAVDDEVYETSS